MAGTFQSEAYIPEARLPLQTKSFSQSHRTIEGIRMFRLELEPTDT